MSETRKAYVYTSIMDANSNATQMLREKNYQQAYQILKRIESTLLQEKLAPTIHLSQINHLLSIVSNNLGCFYYLVEKSQTAERHLKTSLQYSKEECIQDETLLITQINMIILCIKIENFQDACSYINDSFEFLTSIILQDIQSWNPKIRYFLGDVSNINLETIEAILLFYSGVTFQHLGQNENAYSAWRRTMDLLQNDQRSPYYIMAKSKITNLNPEKVQQFLKFQLQNQDNPSNSFLQLSSRIRRKDKQVGSQGTRDFQQEKNLSNIISKLGKEQKIEMNNKKIEINNYFSDEKKVQVQINLQASELLSKQNIKNRGDKALLNRRYGLDIMDKLNKTQQEIYKNYVGKNKSIGSKTQRFDNGNIYDILSKRV